MESTRFLYQELQMKESHTPLIVWKALLDGPLYDQARAAALFVAERMSNPEEVQRIAQQAKTQSLFPSSWDLSFPSAAAELALFYHMMARCFSEQNWQVTAHQYLNLVSECSQQHSLTHPALFGGISGVAFVIQQCSIGGKRYQRTLAHLHQAIATQVRQHLLWRFPPERGVAEPDFDLMSGASGIVAYLTSVPAPDVAVQEALQILLDYLLALTIPHQAPGQERWFCPPSLLETEHDQRCYPSGRFNCGLAHGIAGPLAALSLAYQAGYDWPGMREALIWVSEWLIAHQIQDSWGITWPTVLPHEHASSPEQWRALPGSRNAWCYGPPGIAHSLWLAGQTLQQNSFIEVALEALKVVLRRPISIQQTEAPTLCHGKAGLLLICLHMAQESQDPFLLEQIPLLAKQILAQFDPQNPLGFCDLEPGGLLVNQPSLLTGAPGTALALLAAACDVAPLWDRLLLLS